MDRYVVSFLFFSLLGWVWESIYCTAKAKKWANRGFLFGPVCPIYGCGSAVGLAVYDLARRGALPELSWWQIFLAAFALSMLLEYPTSWLLEKLFHARWWDYTGIPLNLNGRTSVPTSAAFGLAGILVMKALIPAAERVIARVPPAVLNAAALAGVAALAVDVTLTVSAITDFQKKVADIDNDFQEHMTSLVERIYHARDPLPLRVARRIAVFKLSESRSDIAKQLREQRFDKLIERYRNSEVIRQKFDALVEKYRSSDVVQQMGQYVQHGRTTTLQHCENVAWVSYLVNEKLKLNADEKALVEAAILHDLYLYDWHVKKRGRLHGFTHPEVACANAVRSFHIPEKEQEIIKSHMWPLTITAIPRSREALIVCFADKYCALVETLRANKYFGIK